MSNENIQGFYCSRMNKSYIGLKYPLIDRIKLFFGKDERKNNWQEVRREPFIKTWNNVGTGLFNMGKFYLGGSRKPTCFSGWDECDPL